MPKPISLPCEERQPYVPGPRVYTSGHVWYPGFPHLSLQSDAFQEQIRQV